MNTLIVIPAYNEKKSIGDVIRKIKNSYPEIDILVINDGSRDDTARLALDSGAIAVTHLFNMGYGVALQTGYKYATRNRYDFIVQMDGDGQHDPKYIKDLLEEIQNGEADLIIGSRFINNTRYKTPLNRRLGMFLFSRIVSLIIQYRITDSTSGFRALNRKTAEFLSGDIYPGDYPDADVLIMLHNAGFRIKEIPLAMNQSHSSKSMHSGFKPIYYVFKMILSIFVTLLRKDPKRKGRW